LDFLRGSQIVALGETANNVMRQGAENVLRYQPQGVGAEGCLYALDDFRQDAMPEGDSLFGSPLFGSLLLLPAALLFFLFLSVAEVNFAIAVRAHLHKTALLHAVRVNRGSQVITVFVFGKRILGFLVLPRDHFDVFAA
jgi:hypothetical protein